MTPKERAVRELVAEFWGDRPVTEGLDEWFARAYDAGQRESAPAAVMAAYDAGRDAERAAIVEWLRDGSAYDCGIARNIEIDKHGHDLARKIATHRTDEETP